MSNITCVHCNINVPSVFETYFIVCRSWHLHLIHIALAAVCICGGYDTDEGPKRTTIQYGPLSAFCRPLVTVSVLPPPSPIYTAFFIGSWEKG